MYVDIVISNVFNLNKIFFNFFLFFFFLMLEMDTGIETLIVKSIDFFSFPPLLSHSFIN